MDRARFAQKETCPASVGRHLKEPPMSSSDCAQGQASDRFCVRFGLISVWRAVRFIVFFLFLCFESSSVGASVPLRDAPRRGPLVVGALGRFQIHHYEDPLHDFSGVHPPQEL